MPLAFLAPDLIEQILDGRQPARLSLNRLVAANLPLTWQEQRTLFSKSARERSRKSRPIGVLENISLPWT
jgi:hypothetical protein